MNKFMTKNALFGYFWAGTLKKYCHICIQLPCICLTAKFHAKIKILKIGTKNALLACFGQQFRKTVVIFEVWCSRIRV